MSQKNIHYNWHVDKKVFFPKVVIDGEEKTVRVQYLYLFVYTDIPLLNIDSGKFMIVVRKRKVKQAKMYHPILHAYYTPLPVEKMTYSLHEMPVSSEYEWADNGNGTMKKVIKNKIIETTMKWNEEFGEWEEVPNYKRKGGFSEEELRDWLKRRIGEHETEKVIYALDNLWGAKSSRKK